MTELRSQDDPHHQPYSLPESRRRSKNWTANTHTLHHGRLFLKQRLKGEDLMKSGLNHASRAKKKKKKKKKKKRRGKQKKEEKKKKEKERKGKRRNKEKIMIDV